MDGHTRYIGAIRWLAVWTDVTNVLVDCYCQGVVQLFVVEAAELKKADIGVLSKGASDPYCKITGWSFTCFRF